MLKLATRKDMTYSVDWLTEVVRRVSYAHKHERDLETVNMRSSMRLEKVTAPGIFSSPCMLTFLSVEEE